MSEVFPLHDENDTLAVSGNLQTISLDTCINFGKQI